ncbi:MAG TPA: S53 family peptidase [Solirubrobacteraceae bacterium]|nr:S53 family peptidase [Solirubrobacteraceae bacterium]
MSARFSRGVAGVVGVAIAALLTVGAGVATAVPMHITSGTHFKQQPTSAQCEAAFGVACYSAIQVRHAYGVSQLNAQGLTGRGQTIVLVDSYGSPTIQSDLQAFDQANGLPAPPSLDVIAPAGAPPAWNPVMYPDQEGWAEETTLDVEYAHAMAPGANLIEVETPVDETEGVTGLPEMMQGEKYVIDHHLASVISQSFGATELTFQDARGNFDPQLIYNLRYAFEDAAARGVTVLAATGDDGATDYETNLMDNYPFRVIDWPSSDPLVTSVGGTELQLNNAGDRTAPDSVWNDLPDSCFGDSPCAGSGGVSRAFARPFYQDGVRNVVGGTRGTPDVSMSGSCSGAVDFYESFPAAQGFPAIPGGWGPICGTSEATPLFSGEVALADQAAGHSLGLINPSLYQMGDGRFSGLTDITIGNNTVTFTNTDGKTYTVKGYNATPGYDLASGIGESNIGFPLELAALNSHRGR